MKKSYISIGGVLLALPLLWLSKQDAQLLQIEDLQTGREFLQKSELTEGQLANNVTDEDFQPTTGSSDLKSQEQKGFELNAETSNLVAAVNEGRPLELVISGSKRQLLLSPKKLFTADAKILRGNGEQVLDTKNIYVFSGSVGKTDVAVAPDVSGVVGAESTSSEVVPLSGMKPTDLLASFDAKYSNMSVIGGSYTMALRNENRDRILLRNNPTTAVMEMRYEPEAMHKEAFGECSSEGCTHDHQHDAEADMAAAMAAVTPLGKDERAKFNQWIPVDGTSLQASGRPGTDEYQAVTAKPGIDPATGQTIRIVDPIPRGEKYEESLKAFTVWCQTAPELLVEPATPTTDQIAAMMTRILLTMDEVEVMYEKDMGLKLIVGEWMVRTTGDGGVNKSVITDSWRDGNGNTQAHINFYGWGGGGGAAGRSASISAWPVGTAHEIGHIMGSGHSDSNDLMGPGGGPATFFGGFVINDGYNRYTTSQLLYRFLQHNDRIGAGVQQRGIYEKRRIDGEGATDMGSLNGALQLRVPSEIAYANEDTVVTAVNTAVEFDPLANDDRRTLGSPYFNDDLSIEEVSRIIPANAGALEIINGGKNLRFTPTTDFNGVVYFNYTLRGSVGNSGRGWLHRAPVAITVGAPVSDPTKITLAPGQDRWVVQAGGLAEVGYPTMAEMYLSGDSMLLRAHSDATGSENFDVSIGGVTTSITVNYIAPVSSAIDDLVHTDGDAVIRFNPLSNDEVTGSQKTENNISIKVAEVLSDPADKMDFFRRSYVLKSATLDTPAMGSLEVESSFRILRDGSTGVGNTGFLRFTPAAGASGFAVISYTAEDADGKTLNGTARILVGIADVIRPLRKYTTVRRDMGLVLKSQKIPASGAGFSGSSTLQWSVLNKPSGANVTFENGTTETAIARFDQPGRYRLRLSASDNSNTKTIDRWVYVKESMAKHEGDERSPWLDATVSELQGWNQSNWNTAVLGLSAKDDHFASISNIARLGTATRSDGNNAEAQEVVSDSSYESGNHFYGGWNGFSEKGTAAWWELDLGAEKATQWVDVHLGLSMLTTADYENYGLTVELLDASRSEVQTQKLLVKSAAHERHRIAVSAADETSIRYVRIEKPAEVSTLAVHRVRVMSAAENEVDLTLWGTASQSNTPNSDFGAAYALDKRTHDASGSRTDTTTDNNWWQIDFDQEYDIDKIKMYVNARGFYNSPGHISGATITAFNAADSQTWQTTLGADSYIDITGIPSNTMAKRIRVELPAGANNSQGDKLLGINEFWAWGAKNIPLTTTWSQLSGPSSVIFGNTAALDTAVTLTSNGTYVLRLTMDDGWNSTARDFTVNFDAGSTGPSGSGLADLDLTTLGGSNAVDLFAAFDDAETADASMSYQVVSVSNSAIFDGDQVGAIADAANFSLATLADASGSSVVTVRATDGNGNSTELSFTVSTENKPPVGPAVVEFMLNETTALNTVVGTLNFTDPDGDTLTYTLLDDVVSKRYPWLSVASDGTITVIGALPVSDRQGSAGMLSFHVEDGVNNPQPLTVLLTIVDENRAPGIDDQSCVAEESTIPHYPLYTVALNAFNDPNELYSWSILSGNDAGDWSIDAKSGALIPLVSIDANRASSYQLVVQATDNGTPVKSGSATITINVGASTGHVLEDFYSGIGGAAVADMTGASNYPNSPSSSNITKLSGLRFADISQGDFGRRVRGVLTVPTSGSYTFHMASDDASELWLSTDETVGNLTKVIDHTGVTGDLNFNGPASSAISLVTGQKYFFEILHKEAGGADYVGLAWSGPGVTKELIPSSNFQPAFDADGDGLHDWWEATYIGSLSYDGSDDPDGDGLTNSQEYLAQTHPLLTRVAAGAVSVNFYQRDEYQVTQQTLAANHWNNFYTDNSGSSKTESALLDHSGANSGASVSVDSQRGYRGQINTATPESLMESSYWDAGGGDGVISLSSLPEALTRYGYSVRVYMRGTDSLGSGNSSIEMGASTSTESYWLRWLGNKVDGKFTGSAHASEAAAEASSDDKNMIVLHNRGNYYTSSNLTLNVLRDPDDTSNAGRAAVSGLQVIPGPIVSNVAHSVSELQPIGAAVGTLAPISPSAVVTYAISGGKGAESFAVSSSGEITTTAVLDSQEATQYLLQVTATDNGVPAVSSTSIVIINVVKLSLSVADFTVTSESFQPSNSEVDPEETVTVRVAVTNSGATAITPLSATLQPGSGLTIGPNNSHQITTLAAGATHNFEFSFRQTGECGSAQLFKLSFQSDAKGYSHEQSYTLNGGAGLAFTENFDSSSSLASGWSQSSGNASANWHVVTDKASSAPNSMFSPGLGAVNSAYLTSKTFSVDSADARLTFDHSYNLEDGSSSDYDGGVLEISVNGGSWQEITAAGGVIETNGYNGTISSNYNNPIAGQSAWTGDSAGFINTSVAFPASVIGNDVQVRWHLANDSSYTEDGWWIDNVSVTGHTCLTGPSTRLDLSVADNSAQEGDASDSARITISANEVQPTPLTVNYVIGGSAINSADYQTLSGTVTMPQGANSVNIDITALTDQLIEGPESLLLTLSVSADYQIGFGVSGSVNIEDSLFDQYRSSHFSGQTEKIGDLDDFDGDGVSNLAEYAFGLNPTQADQAALQLELVGDPQKLVLSLLQDTALDDITYQFKSSTTLQPDSWSTAGVTTTEGAVDGQGKRTLKGEIPVSNGAKFLRVEVQRK